MSDKQLVEKTLKLRGKLIDILHKHYYPTMHESIADASLIGCLVELIVEISEEIEKVKNPYKDDFYPWGYEIGFERCKREILRLLHPK